MGSFAQLLQNPQFLQMLFGMGAGGSSQWSNAIYPSLFSMLAGSGGFAPQGAQSAQSTPSASSGTNASPVSILSMAFPPPSNGLTGGQTAPASPAASSALWNAQPSAAGAPMNLFGMH